MPIVSRNGIICQTYYDLAKNLGISRETLRIWRKKYGENLLLMNPKEKPIYKGKPRTYADLSRMCRHDISPYVMRDRIVIHGWSVYEAVNTPKYVCRESRRN